MSHPEISVVMGVYNSAPSLSMTINSVLSQEGVDIEFIVVDDGSTDGSRELLDKYAQQDSRLRVFHQPNSGLTAALVKGCKEARGEFIARQDAGGDISLPERLAKQLALFKSSQNLVLVSTGARFVGPDDEHLFDNVLTEQDLDDGLHTLAIPGIRGPCHGSVMFRKLAYQEVGGYRRLFLVAQDIDLWLRLVEIGECSTLTDVLYQSRQTLGSISYHLQNEQNQYCAIAIEFARCRRSGQKEPPLPVLPRFQLIGRERTRSRERANFHYFIGSCLAQSSPRDARGHYIKALQAQPFHLRALWRLVALKK